MKIFWNKGQKQLIGTAFIPKNQPASKFSDAPLPCWFNFNGDAYKKCSLNAAIRLDSETVCSFTGNELIFPETNTRAIWQDAFGARSWG